MPKIKIRIKARQVIHYSQVVEMEPEEYQKYVAMVDRGANDSEFSETFGDWIDQENLVSCGEIKELEMEPYTEKPGQEK